MSSTSTPRRRSTAVLALVASVGVAILAGSAGADTRSTPLRGSMDTSLVTGPACASPVGICAVGTVTGKIHGTIELTAQSAVPSGTSDLTYVESTSVIHAMGGDLFLASSAVVNLSGTSDGEFVSVDRITGGTGTYTGASGYLRSRGFVVGTSDVAEYEGKLILP